MIYSADGTAVINAHLTDESAHKALFDKKADPAIVVSVTLAAANWDSDNKQTVTVAGILADTASQQVMVSPADSAKETYISSGIQVESCSAGAITFSAATKPSADLLVMVSIQNLFATEDTVATPNMVFGTYEGDGEDSQFISLGFTPRVVVICRDDGAFSQANLIYGRMAMMDSAAKTVAIVDGGFNALSSGSLYNGNNPMYSFKYVAIK